MVTITLFLLAVVSRAKPDGGRCLGEFKIDAVTDTCVLSANGGDADEPLAR